ncbi:Dam family site-specific DNA-(adenine-N6)-methyltransferase [Leuconostoc citreum]|uniref:Dam family site-specific DNA-(adenine-N6)-methyltransferase n=1 Tax=Leuconostoc citreum TaxID=33964 RepID=UPI001C20045F|nr:Dam family site-specific DNA-(adenine-N6)-methyltransferase [Leuconostoc citreum]MBU7450212.1 Dam family site-specific DNA-(adenine-N6)-methyltransferase [Leuconostoc citreum]
MRYIGGKKQLLDNIQEILEPHLEGIEKTFVDLFGGSNIVGSYFKKKYQIMTNDLMYFSFVISRGEIQINKPLKFDALKNNGIIDPFYYLNNLKKSEIKSGFITQNYSPAGELGRMYFTEENAKRIDTIRNLLNVWHQKQLITDDEYFYLLASLIEAVPYISNITGTYGAYLKHWDNRALNKLDLKPIELINNGYSNKAFQGDSINLLNNISGDIVYIDTPYNSRQYAPNYHVLETIARYDNPIIKGVTGIRDYSEQKSDFSIKRRAKQSMQKMLENLNFKHAVLSYSTDGIIPELELVDLINKFSIPGTVEKRRISYRKYKSKISNNKGVYELLFYFKPLSGQQFVSNNDQVNNKVTTWKPHSEIIKSPLNYIGGKFKILPQILPLFPQENIHTFVDLFSGGANVGINVDAETHIFNDINYKINELFETFQSHNSEEILQQIYSYINEYQLTKENENGFKKMRVDYNNHPDPIMLYTLVSYSFNYQFRFNSDMQYNNPFGRNRSQFSNRMEQNLINFINRLHEIDARFISQNFTTLDISHLNKFDFVYADPPYLITTGSYNDGKRGFLGWNEEHEYELYNLLDKLNAKGVRFALSNVIDHKGMENMILKNWAKKYTIHPIKKTYKNSSYNTNRSDSNEVLVTNY